MKYKVIIPTIKQSNFDRIRDNIILTFTPEKNKEQFKERHRDLHNWLETENNIVGKYKWTPIYTYDFELEEDAVAFKLRWG